MAQVKTNPWRGGSAKSAERELAKRLAERAAALAAYGVKHKETGLFFTGFDAQTSEPLWGAEHDARHFDRSGAEGQAMLFRSFLINAQQKPVAL